MQTLIKLRRAWNASMIPQPLDVLCLAALNSLPEVIQPRIAAIEDDGVVVAFVWIGPGLPIVPDKVLEKYGLVRF